MSVELCSLEFNRRNSTVEIQTAKFNRRNSTVEIQTAKFNRRNSTSAFFMVLTPAQTILFKFIVEVSPLYADVFGGSTHIPIVLVEFMKDKYFFGLLFECLEIIE
jgi:hypothetical protein